MKWANAVVWYRYRLMQGVAKLAPGPGNVGLAERPERDPAPGEVVLDVIASGVCGTDLHIEDDEFPTSPPMTMGHEVTGVVAVVGDGVDPAWMGSRVVCETFFSTCHTCRFCRSGRPNLCVDRVSIGVHTDGGFAPKLVIPAANLHRVPEWVGEHAAALAEPLACVCNCLFDPPAVTIGDRVVVTGPGPVGLLAAQVARAMGGSVVVAGLPADNARLAEASGLGFETTQAGLPENVDVVIECSGAAGGATACLNAVRRRGTYVQIGIFGKPVGVPLDLVLLKELTVLSGFASVPSSWARAMALVEQRAVDLDPLVTRVASLEQWADVFQSLRAGSGLKVVLDPRL